MSQEEKIQLLKDVEDLILQATVERSHYYTGNVLNRCREFILQSLKIENQPSTLLGGKKKE